jgi:hypothetical protein
LRGVGSCNEQIAGSDAQCGVVEPFFAYDLVFLRMKAICSDRAYFEDAPFTGSRWCVLDIGAVSGVDAYEQ